MQITYYRYIPAYWETHWEKENAEIEPLFYSELRKMKIGTEVFVFHDGKYMPAKITEHDMGSYEVQGENIGVSFSGVTRYIRPRDKETNVFRKVQN